MLLKTRLKGAAFVVETVAHMKGLESDLLPAAEDIRKGIKTLEIAYNLIFGEMFFKHRVGEDLIAWTCCECDRSVVEDDKEHIEHNPGCRVGEFMGLFLGEA